MTVTSTDRAVQARPDPSPRRAAALIALAWLPAIIVAASLPRFVPVFDRWRWELPPLTLALMPVGRLGVWQIVLVGVGLVAVLAVISAVWVRAGLPGWRGVCVRRGRAWCARGVHGGRARADVYRPASGRLVTGGGG